MRRRLDRRRALAVIGGAAALPLGALAARPADAAPLMHEWRGVALGAPAEITLVHPLPEAARRLIREAVAEIRRLEGIFSLYRPESELRRLNRHGRLAAPAHDLVQLLTSARQWGERSGGAFDVTVQPLWDLYAEHFARRPDDLAGPSPGAVERALARVDYRAVEVAADEVRLARPGMAVTLNGIAQGCITDRIALLLREAGIGDVLVHLGEFRGLGRHPERRPWRVGLPGAADGAGEAPVVELDGRAVATSSGRATRFEPTGRHHHLFDPRTGRSARGWRSVSVVAATATTADALATALAILPPPAASELLATVPGAGALLTGDDGRVTRIGSWTPAGSDLPEHDRHGGGTERDVSASDRTSSRRVPPGGRARP